MFIEMFLMADTVRRRSWPQRRVKWPTLGLLSFSELIACKRRDYPQRSSAMVMETARPQTLRARARMSASESALISYLPLTTEADTSRLRPGAATSGEKLTLSLDAYRRKTLSGA